MKLIFHVPPFTLQSGCITKLENFIQEHLKIIGAVGISIACVQVKRARGTFWGAGQKLKEPLS